MGRRSRWLYYYLKRVAFISLAIWGGMHTIKYASGYYDADVKANAQTYVLPNIITVDAKGVEAFLKQPGNVTIIFIYSSRSLLSRWYFDNFNAMAGKYAKQGVRTLYLSVDGDINGLANFWQHRGP